MRIFVFCLLVTVVFPSKLRANVCAKLFETHAALSYGWTPQQARHLLSQLGILDDVVEAGKARVAALYTADRINALLPWLMRRKSPMYKTELSTLRSLRLLTESDEKEAVEIAEQKFRDHLTMFGLKGIPNESQRAFLLLGNTFERLLSMYEDVVEAKGERKFLSDAQRLSVVNSTTGTLGLLYRHGRIRDEDVKTLRSLGVNLVQQAHATAQFLHTLPFFYVPLKVQLSLQVRIMKRAATNLLEAGILSPQEEAEAKQNIESVMTEKLRAIRYEKKSFLNSLDFKLQHVKILAAHFKGEDYNNVDVKIKALIQDIIRSYTE